MALTPGIQTSFLTLVAALLVGCNSTDSEGEGNDQTDNSALSAASGSAQKGPFQLGQTVTATRLESDGSLSTEQATTETNERGRFEFTGLDWEGPTQLAVEGIFFNEVQANFSGENRRLLAITPLTDGQTLATNVNLYTHFIAKRVKVLMEQGEGFDTALPQGRAELKTAFDLDTNPIELNLLQVVDSSEEDSANLLMFSAAVLKAGIDQSQLNDMADDFADDGAINGNGVDELSQVHNEQGDTLLSDARLALKNQYSTEPPNSSESGFAWILDECALQHLNESSRPVFCTDQDDQAEFYRHNHPGDRRTASVLVAQTAGHYWLEISVDSDEDAPFTNEWELYQHRDADERDGCDYRGIRYGQGTGYRHAEGLTDRLDPNEAHCLESYISPSYGDGGPKHLLVNWFIVSEGGPRLDEAVALSFNQTHRGTVANTLGASSDMPAYAYYQFTAKQSGEYRIVVDNYSNGGAGSLRIGLFEDEDNSGGITFYNDQERLDFIGGPGTDSTSTEMTKTLSAGTYAIRIFNGTHYRGDSDSYPVEFDIEVTKQ